MTWSGDALACVGASSCTLTLDADKSITVDSCPTRALTPGADAVSASLNSRCFSQVRTGGNTPYNGDRYSFSPTSDGVIEISAISSAFDPYIFLLTLAGDLRAQDDDGGGGSTARITYPVTAGNTYIVEVTQSTNHAPRTGAYSISLNWQDGGTDAETDGGTDAETDGGAIALDQTVSGAIDPGGDADAWTFQGTAGQVVSITVLVDNLFVFFDPTLELTGPDGSLIASDDDSGVNLQPLIADLTLPADGLYTITVRAFREFQTGGYQLDLEIAAAAITLPAAFVDLPPRGTFRVWTDAAANVRAAIAGLEDQILIVWLWNPDTFDWASYTPDIPAAAQANFIIATGSILWVVGR